MSKENVVSFSQAINTNSELKKRLNEAEARVDVWVNIAHDAGFEFSAEEFTAVVSDALGRRVSAADAVREFLSVQRLTESELSESALSAVVGGVKNRFTVTV